MTLKEYLENLNAFVANNPDALDLEVVASADDEGNRYNRVCYTPVKGYFYDRYEFDVAQDAESKVNAVCVN